MFRTTFQKRIFSFFTIFTFTLGSIAPEALQAASAKQDAQDLATILNSSKKIFSEKGRTAYAKHVFQGADARDKKFIESILPEVSQMASVRAEGSSVFVQDGDREIEVKLVSGGNLIIDGKRFQWKGNQSFKKNYDRVAKLFIKEGKYSFLNNILEAFVPSAHAEDDTDFSLPEDDEDGAISEASNSSASDSSFKKTLTIAIAAVVAVATIGILWYLNEKSKRDAEVEKTKAQTQLTIAQMAEETKRQELAQAHELAIGEHGGGESGGEGESHSGGEEVLQ